MTSWEKRVKYPGLPIAPYEKGQNARYFKLVAQPIKQNILSEIEIDTISYNGVTPGPLILVKSIPTSFKPGKLEPFFITPRMTFKRI